MSLLARSRLVVLDTSHFVGLVADTESDCLEKRRAAREFVPSLLETGWLPLLCSHHIEELLQHASEQLVDARVRFLRDLPYVACVRGSNPKAGAGSIADVLAAEVIAAYRNPAASAIQVRDLARDALLLFGSGADAVPEVFLDWRSMRDTLAGRQDRAREVAAIRRWQPQDIGSTRMSEWINQPLRGQEEVTSNLELGRENLQREIAARGDKRISDPAGVAAAFMAEVTREGDAARVGNYRSPVTEVLINAGLDPEDIDPSATWAEMMDLLIFRNRLRGVAEARGLAMESLKRGVTRQQLPVMLIEESVRRHSHDQPERKGSELNDTHMLCLAPYADVTYVDKRTLESVRRIRSKVPDFEYLVGVIDKAAGYGDIAARLAAYPNEEL